MRSFMETGRDYSMFRSWKFHDNEMNYVEREPIGLDYLLFNNLNFSDAVYGPMYLFSKPCFQMFTVINPLFCILH